MRSRRALPVRLQITFGFLFVFGALLVVLEVVDERMLVALQERMIQEDLAFKVAQVKGAIRTVPQARDVPESLSMDGSFVEVLGPDGRILSRSDNLEGANLPPVATNGVMGSPAGETMDEPVITASTTLSIPGKAGYQALVGLPIAAVEEAFSHKRVSGLLALSVGLLLTGIIGYFYSAISMRPVERVRKEVEAIEAEDVQRRIDTASLPRDEIGRLADTFNDLLDRVAAVRDKQQRFIADASHDLRSPLTIIAGHAQLFFKRGREDPALLDGAIRGILRETNRLRRLVDDLLILAQPVVEDGPCQVVDLGRIAAEMVAGRRELQPEICLGELTPAPVMAMADDLRRIIANLMDNAARAVAGKGTVEVAVRSQGEIVRLTVRDDGIGIPLEEQARVFDRFYRLDTTRNSDGSGLGLSIVQSLVGHYQGRVFLESAPGEGTLVAVELPLARAAQGPGTNPA